MRTPSTRGSTAIVAIDRLHGRRCIEGPTMSASGTYRDAWFGPAYLEHWEPYLERAGLELIDRIEAAFGPPAPGARILDIGAGTGLLAAEVVRRWPGAHVIAADPAQAMLDVIGDRLADAERTGRIELLVAAADELPLPDASVDLVISSFVYQLVEDRPTALREALRVLAPGGRLGYVTWLKREGVFRPAEAVDEAMGGPTNTDWSGGAPRAGDLPSLEAAERELVAAGFDDVRVAAGELAHDWSPETYLRYLEGCRNAADFAALAAPARSSLRARVRDALESLPPDAFRSRAPVVYALARVA
jgi:ubiquinone/menaquinone biosynthesis C-methylase UbiE